MLSLRITPQIMQGTQAHRRMSTVVIFFLLLFLPGSSSPAPFGSSSKTQWISCDRQLPEGSGFIVSDNYPLEYADNLSCVYTIPLQPGTHGPSAICLRFQRFRMEKMRDYLEIHGQPWLQNASGFGKHHEFTGSGEVMNPSHPVGFFNVWEDQFCWIPNHGEAYLKLVFHSDISAGDLGFFASYKTITMQQIQSNNNIQVATLEVGLPSCGVVCFDRSCSGGQACPSSAAGGCADRSDRSYAHSRCKTASNAPVQVPGQLACDFDLPGCGSLWTGGRMWQRTSRNHDTVFGPSSGRNFYMVMDFSSSRADWLGDITVAVPTSMEGKTQCLSFWYHMDGPDVGQLRILWQDSLRTKGALWNRVGSYGNYWHHTHFSLFILEGNKNNNITFTAKRGSEYRAQIAIDELSLMEGPCPYYDDISCTFNDHHLCGWKWSANTHPIMLEGMNVILRYHCQAPSCGVSNTSSGVILTSPPVAVTRGYTCLILSYRFGVKDGELVVRRSLQVINKQSSRIDLNTGWQQAQYTISPLVGNESITSRIEIESYMSTGGVFEMEEITFVPISCENISLGTCKSGEFRCRLTGTCVSKKKLCNEVRDCGMWDDSDEANCQYKTGCYGKFTCDNQVCIEHSLTCNGFDDCGDNSDEKNCDSSSQPGISYSPVALIALVAGCILILLIVAIKIGLCLHVRYKRRRLIRLRERRLEALRGMGRCNSIESLHPEFLPPAYADCIRDNPAFVLGEESEGEDKRELPSYSEAVEGGFLMITHPLKSELQRLRMGMQERTAEEGTSASEQQNHQVESAIMAVGQDAALETTVIETSSDSGYQDSQGQSVESDHQIMSTEIENQETPLDAPHQTPYIESSSHAPPLDPCHQEPNIAPVDDLPSVEQDLRLPLQLHHRPSQQPAVTTQSSHNADDTNGDIDTGVQCLANGLLPQTQPVELAVQPLSVDTQVQTQPSSHYQSINTVEDPRLDRQTPSCTEGHGHVSDNSASSVQVSESGENAVSLQLIKDSPIYMLPNDSCPTHVSLAIWDDSEIHV